MAKDVDLFAAAVSGVKPLKGHKPTGRARLSSRGRRPRSPSDPSGHRRGRSGGSLRSDDKGAGTFSRRSEFRPRHLPLLSRGKLLPQASLDLHGMALAAAERAVSTFLEDVTARDLRVVLIVTGKGLRLEGGRMLGSRIRSEFVGWLNRADNRHRVRAVRASAPAASGGGAFYVLLRRPSASRSAASSRSCAPRPSDSRSGAARADGAMAGNDAGHGVGGAGAADGAGRARRADAAGDLAVGPGLFGRDLVSSFQTFHWKAVPTMSSGTSAASSADGLRPYRRASTPFTRGPSASSLRVMSAAGKSCFRFFSRVRSLSPGNTAAMPFCVAATSTRP